MGVFSNFTIIIPDSSALSREWHVSGTAVDLTLFYFLVRHVVLQELATEELHDEHRRSRRQAQ